MTQIKKILASDNNVENRVINTNLNNEKLGIQAIGFFLKNIEELAKTKNCLDAMTIHCHGKGRTMNRNHVALV